MKNIFSGRTMVMALLNILLLGSCTSSCIKKSAEYNVMTFNIRLDEPSDSLNNWKYRKANVAQMINFYEPDIIGLQEVCNNQMEDLKASLKNYLSIGVGRDDGKTKGEYCPIFYNKNKYELSKSGNFSLSEYPDSFGIRGWDASYNRIATWGVFKSKENQERILVYNTHLDNDGKVARAEGIKLILRHIKENNRNLPVIITGDFNSEPEDKPLQILREAGYHDSYHDANMKYGPSYTFHDFGRLPVEKCEQIDYIATSEFFIPNKSRVIEDKVNGWNLSDHYPIMINLLH